MHMYDDIHHTLQCRSFNELILGTGSCRLFQSFLVFRTRRPSAFTLDLFHVLGG